jgi:hypothetical protein
MPEAQVVFGGLPRNEKPNRMLKVIVKERQAPKKFSLQEFLDEYAPPEKAPVLDDYE